MLTSVWHVARTVLTVIGALSVFSFACLLWAARQAGRRADARQREFDAQLDAILRDWAGEAR